ncbi:MAG: hypothetical protein LUG98_04165 [Tannerellaceae bacterium]|nr:hypothetical protein [Tannerellaceae bacterium]
MKYMFAFLLASLIFYGGAGVNLMSYCCGDCRTAGVAVVLSDKCCEIHDHHHGEAATHEPGNSHHHAHTGCHHHTDGHQAEEACAEHLCETNCCDMERLSFEWENSTSSVQQPLPVEMDLSVFGLPSMTLLTSLELEQDRQVEEYSPPLKVCPRVYLSILTTLLI